MVAFQANPSDDWFCLSIVYMTVIPGKEIINPVHGSHGDVEGITDGFSGDRSFLNKRFRDETTSSVIARRGIPDKASSRRLAASLPPFPASSMTMSEANRSKRCRWVSHQSTVTFCQAAANKSLDGRAVRYDTIEVSI